MTLFRRITDASEIWVRPIARARVCACVRVRDCRGWRGADAMRCRSACSRLTMRASKRRLRAGSATSCCSTPNTRRERALIV